jgi:hypothetical protein
VGRTKADVAVSSVQRGNKLQKMLAARTNLLLLLAVLDDTVCGDIKADSGVLSAAEVEATCVGTADRRCWYCKRDPTTAVGVTTGLLLFLFAKKVVVVLAAALDREPGARSTRESEKLTK